MTKTDLDRIASEISQSFLLAVCAKADIACQITTKPFDDIGIDIDIQLRQLINNIDNNTNSLKPIGSSIKVQIKACYGSTLEHIEGSKYKYHLKTNFYDTYSENDGAVLLVVMRLPQWSGTNDEYSNKTTVESWMSATTEHLLVKNFALFKLLEKDPKYTSVIHFDSDIDLLTPENLKSKLDFIKSCFKFTFTAPVVD